MPGGRQAVSSLTEGGTEMKWEELTSSVFARAVEEAEKVCVLAMGVLEKHG